jgi:hypothetical protein
MALRGVHAFGQTFDLEVKRLGNAPLRASTAIAGGPRQTREITPGQSVEFSFA